MAPEDMREPSLNELCEISVLGNVAYAVRCARRMQPRFKLPPNEPDGDQITAAVDEAMGWAEAYIRTGAGDKERGQWLVETTAVIAEATYEITDFSAFAAQHAVRGAMLAARGGATLSTEDFMEVVASAYGSSRVLIANTPPWLRLLIMQTLRADYDKLAADTVKHASQRGEPFDPTPAGPLGPLWPDKTPTW